MKLDKYLVECGINVRKSCREDVLNGFVKVNNIVITNPALNIDEKNDLVEYKGEKVYSRGKVYYMFNKPSGCITARSDENEKTVFEYFKDVNMNGISHVGRLDKDTEGLLLFTNDGDLSNELMRPEKHMSKKYYFIALGEITKENKKSLEEGISIGENEPITKKAKLEIVKSGEYRELEEELNLSRYYACNKEHYKQNIVAGFLTVTEGRKHVVKRMLKAAGCYIIYLKREAIGSVYLDSQLKGGEYRKLNENEIESLKQNKTYNL